MPSRREQKPDNVSCSTQGVDQFHSKNPQEVLAKKQHANSHFSKSPESDTSAGFYAGVFFGRLNRRFVAKSSRRFSGPSAEFISVTRLRTSVVSASQETGVANAPLRAPMNNPNRKMHADLRTGFFKPGT
jgi:hypothetical protein